MLYLQSALSVIKLTDTGAIQVYIIIIILYMYICERREVAIKEKKKSRHDIQKFKIIIQHQIWCQTEVKSINFINFNSESHIWSIFISLTH